MREIEQTRHQGWPDVLVASSRAELLKAVGAAQRRGELGAVGLLHCADVGVWSVRVVRLRDPRPPAPAWRRPVLVGGAVVLVLGGAAALGWWLVGVTVAAVSFSLPGVLGAAAMAVVGLALLRGGCTVVVKVTHHRH